jgi:hypothetical protein
VQRPSKKGRGGKEGWGSEDSARQNSVSTERSNREKMLVMASMESIESIGGSVPRSVADGLPVELSGFEGDNFFTSSKVTRASGDEACFWQIELIT